MLAMKYEVRIVGKTDLPRRQDWALVETRSRVILLVKEDALDVELLAEVWAAGRKLRGAQPSNVRAIVTQREPERLALPAGSPSRH